MNRIKEMSDQIRKAVINALDSFEKDGALASVCRPDFVVEIPSDKQKGDFATNAALAMAKTYRLPPRQLAEQLTERFYCDGIERVEIAGPGFINFFLSKAFFASTLQDVLQEKEQFGTSLIGKGKKVMVEFVSANPTGPMHIGNARGGAVGDSLASVLCACGYEVTREFYVNDAGNQIEKFALSLATRYLQIFEGEEKYPFPEDGYHGEDIKEHARVFAEEEGDKYVKLPFDELKEDIVAFALPKNLKALHDDLQKYRIEYDVWFKESELHREKKIDAVLAILKEKGLLYEKDDAVWYKATEFGGEKDEVMVRGGGAPTYFAADIAYHYNKFAERGFDRVINIWGADHHGHVARLKGAMNAVGLSGDKLDIVLMQLVRLMRGDEIVRVSKRTGKSITLANLLEEVPVDAARFFFNLREVSSHLDFDLSLAVEQSSQNPVYYVQYAHARICSIIKAMEKEEVFPEAPSQQSLCRLNSPEEIELIRHMGALPSEIQAAAENMDPSRLTKYVLSLAALFHKFYAAHRVMSEDKELTAARTALCLATRQVLRNVLTLLKVDFPEKM